MAGDKNNQSTGKRTIKIANQKTFTFNQKKSLFGKRVSAKEIDNTINKWLGEMAKAGTPAQLGKYLNNAATGEIIAIFLYTTTIEVDDVKQS